MKKEMKGKTLDGLGRTYTFSLLKHKEGVKLQHQYASLAIMAYNHLQDTFQKMADSVEDKDADKEAKDTEPQGAAGILATITQIFNWERTEELAKKLLCNATVSGETEEGETFSFTTDKDGFCELFAGDLLEFYTAIFYAAVANYPKYLLPFLDTVEEDSTQDS